MTHTFKKNHSEDYLKVPLAFCNNYFWCTFNKETYTFLHGDLNVVLNSGSLSKYGQIRQHV